MDVFKLNHVIENLPKEQLVELVNMLAKNTLALDGVWFQSVENKRGMDEAVEHDRNAWRLFTEIEARRIKTFLHLPDNSGIEGLKQALGYRFNGIVNRSEIHLEGNTLVYKVVDCRVQTARKRKGMPFHPCREVGIVEYTYFAKIIDDRFVCEAVSCYPLTTDPGCACAWKFTLHV